MTLIFPDGWFAGDTSSLSEAELQELRLSFKQTSLYNSCNEVIRGLAYEAKSLGYDSPKDCLETKERYETVTASYTEKIKAIDKQVINKNEKIMMFVDKW